MPGFISVVDGRYVGEHTCPPDERELAARRAFFSLCVRDGLIAADTLEERVNLARETCVVYALRMNSLALRVAFTRSHPAATLLEDALRHLTAEQRKEFDEQVKITWSPAPQRC